MKTLIAFGMVSLAAITLAQAAECQPPAGATCTKSENTLRCRTETCDQKGCRVISTLMREVDGKCIVSHSVVYRQKVRAP